MGIFYQYVLDCHLYRQGEKQVEKLPERVRLLLFQLAREIETAGPVRGD